MSKILMIDDEEAILLLCQMELEEVGYDVITHEHGHDLVYHTRRMEPDLVIVDIKLDNYSGLEFLKEIRKMKEFQSLPIIVYSASSYHHQDMSVFVPPDYFVQKSFDLTVLKTTIEKALEAKK